jgi:hypothetical protein
LRGLFYEPIECRVENQRPRARGAGVNDMKLVSYQYSDNQLHLGAVSDDRVINLNQASGGALPDDMLRFLQLGSGAMQTARDAVAQADGEMRLDDVKLLSPVPNPSKVVAIGLNYMDHIREANLGMPKLATMFCKYPSSVIGSGEDIRWSTSLTEQVDYEAELAVVIGKTARNVDAEVAYDYVAGYMNCKTPFARWAPTSSRATKSRTRTSCRYSVGSTARSGRIPIRAK